MNERRAPAFNLPRLTAEVDCEPIGYPGLLVHFWLNVTYDPDRVTDEAWAKQATEHKEATGEDPSPREAWESDYYYAYGRIVDRVSFPAELTAGGEPLEIRVGSGKALYDLMCSGGFEQDIILWAATQYYRLKDARLRTESKN